MASRLELDGTDPERKALDALQQLRTKGLVQGRRTNATRGKGGFWEFKPAIVTPDQLISTDRKYITVVNSVDSDDTSKKRNQNRATVSSSVPF